MNDGFVVELDTSTWTTNSSEIIAPNNFAFDGEGNVVSINSTGVGGMTAAAGAGTAFDGVTNNNGAATGLLEPRRPRSPPVRTRSTSRSSTRATPRTTRRSSWTT